MDAKIDAKIDAKSKTRTVVTVIAVPAARRENARQGKVAPKHDRVRAATRITAKFDFIDQQRKPDQPEETQ
jgi:hypothetical protein